MVNKTCLRMFAEWDAAERQWEPVDFLRATNAAAAIAVTMMREAAEANK